MDIDSYYDQAERVRKEDEVKAEENGRLAPPKAGGSGEGSLDSSKLNSVLTFCVPNTPSLISTVLDVKAGAQPQLNILPPLATPRQ